MTDYNTPNYIISYELFCPIKRCNIRHAFVCAENMIDKRVSKMRQLAGFVVKGRIKVGDL